MTNDKSSLAIGTAATTRILCAEDLVDPDGRSLSAMTR